MSTKQNAKFQELVVKLREIFQIDRPELDFGIYRILNARVGEINDYLESRLAEKVQAALAAGDIASAQQLQAELQEAEKNAHALGVSPDGVPKVQELRTKLKEATTGVSEHENAVFSHLLAFFSRYYDNGDFISQRRYKGDTYSIPYGGEEVMLYWANKDQYYTKSGENFSNYSFKLDDGRAIHFRLVVADTAKDNRKDNNKERRFALVEKKTVTRIDEQGDEYEEELLPVEEVDRASGKELIVRFEYKPVAKGTKQDALVEKAVQTVLADDVVKARWLDLGRRAPTEKNPQRTLLEKHLSDYTTKNTADYFIHKDLGGFLRRELDFYIKNEVMNLDDVQNAGTFSNIEKSLRMIQCLRSIALDLITFLAQLEDFQKKLWLKRKFVVSSHYCVTLDRVPEALYPEIAENERQWRQWMELGVWTSDGPGTIEDLKSCRFMMVDTSVFDRNFLHRLLAATEDIDRVTDGLVVKSENFQGLTFLAERYRSGVKCVYIDPPYNTGNDSFLYRDQYRHSSWLTLLNQSMAAVSSMLGQGASFFASCDDNESSRLKTLLDTRFGEANLESQMIVQSNKRGQTYKSVAKTHEYLFAYDCDVETILNGLPRDVEDAEKDAHGPYELWELRNRNPKFGRFNRPNLFFPLYASESQFITRGFSCVSTERTSEYSEEIYPRNSEGADSCWRWGVPTVRKESGEESGEITDKNLVAKKTRGGEWRVFEKARKSVKAPKSILSDVDVINEKGTVELGSLGFSDFSFPKPVGLMKTVVRLGTKDDDLMLDYFAGTGTTGHGVIAMNREDGAKRRYILVEQGEYFDAILVPRLQKITFSAEWDNGKPAAPETGVSHCFKVIKLESYEDTLNNLQLRRPAGQDDLFAALPQAAKDDYLLRYMLDLESRGSLLSVEDFKKPFDYKANIAVDSAGAYEPRKVDLVETFNYLIGLTVKHIDAQPERGFVTITGTLPSRETCLVLWRDCEMLDYEGISKLCDKLAINPADNEFDVVYINGDHNIPTVLTQTQEEGGATRVLKLRQIEPEFLSRMFSMEDI
ncbi:site-specific DNA-methyltransferase [Burkholderia pseudomallei]|uniref:site-specific DNA-methyltransferase n=1 Tax=Burkholderia pseudomallei TaxID=28450 RepID=UPI001AAF9FBB|nr:site-specific DNA-methyltransferase [Burkholderia pseudomallei]MBO2984107.1 site-specific DNA-methyltransferase [Burkholderia pseudomallei]MBO7916207.1 site-specific DNA-methyltransferase [Burkholderia pseudomallei]